ncbi:uncharacterized protein LOC144366066 [Ictidomys tridecemlineatus]
MPRRGRPELRQVRGPRPDPAPSECGAASCAVAFTQAPPRPHFDPGVPACGPGGGGEGGGRAGLLAAGGEKEVVPAGARPGRGNAQPARPPPGPPRPPAPSRLWRAEPRAAVAAAAAAAAAAADVARLPGGANNAGLAKQKGSTSSPSRSFTCALWAPRGIPGRQGPRPQGPESRAPRLPRRPPPLCPPTRLAGARPAAPRRARTPGPQGSGRIVPAARRALRPGRPRPPHAHPPGSGGRSRGCLGNRRRDAAAAAALRTPLRSGFFFPFFFFFPILMGRKVTAYFAFINSHHNKNPGANATSGRNRWRGDRRRGPRAGIHPRAPRRNPGRGRGPKMSSEAGSVSFALLLLLFQEWRSEARARRPQPAAAGGGKPREKERERSSSDRVSRSLLAAQERGGRRDTPHYKSALSGD